MPNSEQITTIHNPGFKMPEVILASGSPRRRELLERFWGSSRLVVMIPKSDEQAAIEIYFRDPDRNLDNQATIRSDAQALSGILSSAKLAALEQQFTLPDYYVAIAADTLVVQDDQILGKPTDSNDAARMLRLLSARSHIVITGISLLVRCGEEKEIFQAAEQTIVRFAPLSDAQIRWYIATGEPLDKAGAYGIQGYGAALVESIEGCYYNVMGLPVNRLMDLLQKAADRFISFPGLSKLLPWH